MADIVIVGAGLGGMPMAFEMKEHARSQDRVIVVSGKDYFHFVPSNPWIAVNWRQRDEISVPLGSPRRNKGIELVVAEVTRVNAEVNRLELATGESLAYDHLIIASGPRLAFDEIPGLGPDGFTQSICHVDHAERARAGGGGRRAGRILLWSGL
jgi:sulfide:quinone oxidoreductase